MAGAAALTLLGLPHGAVDHRVARPLLHPVFGRGWFMIFTFAYLGLAGFVLLEWAAWPVAGLIVFLVVSAFHFGSEDAVGRGTMAIAARGGLPIAAPILFHLEETERFFAILGGTPSVFDALIIASLIWLPTLPIHLLSKDTSRGERLEMAAILVVFAALPPLAGFAFYFLAVHSPRHAAELAARRDPASVTRGWGWALWSSVPLTLAALFLGALLFTQLSGTTTERFVRAVFWGLGALTVPHLILQAIDRRAGSNQLS